ncbi:MAG: hypothetical protein WBG18_19735 [Xanthobacteraceae bacterium]
MLARALDDFAANRVVRNYQRLSRYSRNGLIWLLHGRPVVALAKDTAVIQTTNGTVSYYRLLRPAGGAQR